MVAPLRAARLAASTLVSMPPRPMLRAGAAGHALEFGVAGLRLVDEARARVLARIGRVQAALVGQDHQRVGVDQVGDQRAQRVVVAELDLVVDDGVVLVDDRDDARAPSSVSRVERAFR